MQLHHQNIVTVYGTYENADSLGLVEELAATTLNGLLGWSFGSAGLYPGTPLPLALVARIGADIAEGLAYAHAQGISHNDVKSPNILLFGDPKNYTAKLADFGLVRKSHFMKAAVELSGVTVQGFSAYWAPPEATKLTSPMATSKWSRPATCTPSAWCCMKWQRAAPQGRFPRMRSPPSRALTAA